ncbi:MAG: conjugal transfer protein TraF [Gammaproteobacteria bacterium]|nr:conjugal transfer protein TraF [Gammaproteobacteria bacterium]
MSRKKSIRYAGAFMLTAIAGSAGAVPFSSFDARTYAMGGAGVAAGTAANAVFINPAFLARSAGGEAYSLELPVIGGRVTDPGLLSDAIDEFNEIEPIGVFQDAVDAYIATPDAGTAAGVQSAGSELIDQLQNVSGKILSAEADLGFVVGIPHPKFGLAAYVNANVVGGAVGEASAEDLAAIQQAMDDAQNLLALDDPTDTLTSLVGARFSRVTEVGVAIARDFDVLGGLSVGITPKIVAVRTYDFLFVGSEIDTAEVSLSDSQQDDMGITLDVGLAKEYENGWKLGLVVKNLIPQDYETVLGNEFRLEPMARAGVAYANSCLTAVADLDLTENDASGYEPKTRYASLGTELYLFEIARLRLGYRHNLSDVPANTEADLVTGGLGFTSFGVQVDLAVAGNGDEFGAAMQLGFRF